MRPKKIGSEFCSKHLEARWFIQFFGKFFISGISAKGSPSFPSFGFSLRLKKCPSASRNVPGSVAQSHQSLESSKPSRIDRMEIPQCRLPIGSLHSRFARRDVLPPEIARSNRLSPMRFRSSFQAWGRRWRSSGRIVLLFIFASAHWDVNEVFQSRDLHRWLNSWSSQWALCEGREEKWDSKGGDRFDKFCPFLSAGRVSQQWTKLKTWRELRNLADRQLWAQSNSEIRIFLGKLLREGHKEVLSNSTIICKIQGWTLWTWETPRSAGSNEKYMF